MEGGFRSMATNNALDATSADVVTSSMLEVGQKIALEIEKPAAGGRMIARVDGQVVLVADAIPGERVIARVTRVTTGVAFADTQDVETASADRRAAFVDPLCGGSAYAHIDYARQLTIKGEVIVDAFTRIGRLRVAAPVLVVPSREDGYRMRARLHRKGARLGFFREGSHEVCDVRPTRQLLDASCDVLDAIAAHLNAVGATGVREVEIAENVDATLRAVHLASRDALPFSELAPLSQIPGVTGVLVTAPAQPGAAPETRLFSGDPYVVDRVELEARTVSFRRHVRAFFQGNRHLLGDLVAHVTALASEAPRVLDLYAGVGLFAVSIATARDARVIAVEGDLFAARDLEVNAASAADAASASGARQVTVSHRSVEHFLSHAPAAVDLVVLDPPRTGLSPDALRGLAALRPPQIVYVSCDVATLARDVRQLVQLGGYQPDRIEAFDLFPNTPHVETVVRLSRS